MIDLLRLAPRVRPSASPPLRTFQSRSLPPGLVEARPHHLHRTPCTARVGRWSWLLAGGITSAACVHTYDAPRPDEPHAIVKFRRSYETMLGTTLREVVTIDDHPSYSATVSTTELRGPRHDAQLVRPQPATFSTRSAFFHLETRMVWETVWVPDPYQTIESYACGGRRMCLGSVTRVRLVPRPRWVPKVVEVLDATCANALRFAPVLHGSYLLQYTFQEHGMCSLACYSQSPKPDGGFDLRPCPAAPPED